MAKSDKGNPMMSFFRRMRAPEELPVAIKNREKFDLAKRMELESILLLSNVSADGRSMLPLDMDRGPVAIFGNGHVVTNTGGGGSGGSMGSFRYSFVRGMNSLGAPFVKSLYDYYKGKADEGGGSYTDVHGWITDDVARWGEPQFSNSGWNNSAPIAIPELMLDNGEILGDGLVAAAASEARTAIVFISRTVGTEEMDRGLAQPSDWYLNPSEITLLQQVADKFANIVLVVNSSGSMDLTWTRLDWAADKIKAIVWSYGAGSYYGEALAELLYGRENFSAKLADTMTWRLEDHYTTRNFGGSQSYRSNGATGTLGFASGGADFSTRNGADDPISIYQEYIYTGFRYFDTFCGGLGENDPVMYPFGFGLGYSTFSIDDFGLNLSGSTVAVRARITNTSETAGQEVLQVYLSAPNDKTLDQPYQKLMAYAKTGKLQAGDNCLLTAEFTLADAASYSEDLAAMILEEGDYVIRVGNSSRNTQIAGILTVMNGGRPVVLERLANRLTLDSANPNRETRSNRAAFEALRLNSQATLAQNIGNAQSDALAIARLSAGQRLAVSQASLELRQPVEKAPEQGRRPADRTATLQSVVNGEISLADFVSQMTDAELVALLSGGSGIGVAQGYPDDIDVILTSCKSKPSEPNSYNTGAGTSRSIPRLGIPSISYSDGSAGIPIALDLARRLNTDPNPAYPRAAGIACIWDMQVQRAWGREVALEMLAANVDIWLAPSINLHRNPLTGRNTEYYSEDPILSGRIATAVAQGVAEQGVTVCLKHLAGNDQEQFRRGRHTKISELENNSLDAINTISAERALRETTLKPFEMAVKNADVRCVMSAFNKINGQYCSASRELLLDILRGEWDFKGFVVTDWGDYDEIANAADELENGNDMIMSGVHTRYSIPAQIWNGLRGLADYDGVHTGSGKDELHPLTRSALERNARSVLHTIINSRLVFADGRYNTGTINGTEVPCHVRSDLTILTTVLPAAAVGAEYSKQKISPLLAAGDEGTSHYTFSIADNSQTSAAEFSALGLTLHGDGRITGQPNPGSNGVYKITFQVASDSGTAQKELELDIQSIAITPEILPGARLGMAYEQTICVVGGVGQTTLALGGNLPAGLVFDAATGRVSGMPAESARCQNYRLTAQAVDQAGNVQTREYSIDVADTIDVIITPPSRATVEVGENVRIPIKANRRESSDMYSFEIAYGQLPEGLFVGGFIWMGYSISGTPVLPGIYEFGIKVIVSYSLPEISIIIPYTIEVLDAQGGELQLKTARLPDGRVNEVYSAQVSVSGGGAKTYSLDSEKSSPELPTGLMISEGGLLTCSPMASDSGLYKVAVQATVKANAAISKTFVLPLYIGGILDVQPAPGSVFTAETGKPFVRQIKAVGGFSNQFKYTRGTGRGDTLPAGLELSVNPDYTATISGVPADGQAGNYDLVIDIDEEFSGSPVATTVIYTLVIK